MSTKTDAKPESAYLALSPKRREFVDAYIRCKFNGTKAAIEAGYSKKTAEDQAARLLGSVGVKEAIEEKCAALAAKNDIKSSDVLKELASLGFSNIRNICRWSGNILTVRDSRNLPPEITAAISEIAPVQFKDGTSGIKIKLHNKTAALEMLGRYLKMFTDKMEVTGKDGEPVAIKPDLSRLNSEELRALLVLSEKVAPK